MWSGFFEAGISLILLLGFTNFRRSLSFIREMPRRCPWIWLHAFLFLRASTVLAMTVGSIVKLKTDAPWASSRRWTNITQHFTVARENCPQGLPARIKKCVQKHKNRPTPTSRLGFAQQGFHCRNAEITGGLHETSLRHSRPKTL